MGYAKHWRMKIMSALAVKEVVEPAARGFAGQNGHELDMFFGPVGALQAKIAAGETADVTILTAPVLEALQKAGMLAGRWDLGMVGVGVAMREGAPRPDLSTPEAFKKTLLAARSIALTDPGVGGTAGIYVAKLIEQLGLADALKPKTRLQKNGFYVAEAVASGEAELGMTQMSEIVAVKGAAVAGPLPPPLQVVTTYSAGIFTGSARQDSARALLRLLVSPALDARWKECGFEIPERAESK